jgi:phosphopantetheine adenylyltransferase
MRTSTGNERAFASVPLNLTHKYKKGDHMPSTNQFTMKLHPRDASYVIDGLRTASKYGKELYWRRHFKKLAKSVETMFVKQAGAIFAKPRDPKSKP